MHRQRLSIHAAVKAFGGPKNALRGRARNLNECKEQVFYKNHLRSKWRVIFEQQEKELFEHIAFMKNSLFGLTYKGGKMIVYTNCGRKETGKKEYPEWRR